MCMDYRVRFSTALYFLVLALSIFFLLYNKPRRSISDVSFTWCYIKHLSRFRWVTQWMPGYPTPSLV